MYTDTHAHIRQEFYESLDELIENCKNNNVTKIINNGTDLDTNEDVLLISLRYSEIYPAIGFHPQNLEGFKFDDLIQIENNIDKIVAIGEIGLDYYVGYEDKGLQQRVFEAQLQIAEKYDKPVIIHSREATKDTIDILRKYPKVRGSIHCFNGSIETANIYIKMGFMLGLNGVITFKNFGHIDVIKEIPLENIILETDSPYLTPEPKRGHKNDPSNIPLIAQKIADIKGIDIKSVADVTEANVHTLFDI